MKDVFISYSSKDRTFVDELCSQLRKLNITFWLDRFEIKPGDYLRQKINAGLRDAEYLLAVLSPNSIKSEWASCEIDAAMMHELSQNKVTLIPLLIGDIKHSDLPPDLQGKLYLDFREGLAHGCDDLQRLVEFLRPDIRRRKELIAELRTGLPGTPDKELKLREFALFGTDQTIQKAALTGLVAAQSPSSICVIVERLLDKWGLNTINHAVRMLRKLGPNGLAGLAAAVFWDDRFIGTRFRLISEAVNEEERFKSYVTGHSIEGSISLVCASAALTDYSPPLISAAARFSAQYWFDGVLVPFFLPELRPREVKAAARMLDAKVPGLTGVISRRLVYRGFTQGKEAGILRRGAIYHINTTIMNKV